jgi:hypothetical protein
MPLVGRRTLRWLSSGGGVSPRIVASRATESSAEGPNSCASLYHGQHLQDRRAHLSSIPPVNRCEASSLPACRANACRTHLNTLMLTAISVARSRL